jgi:4-methyl-5(b-hydroxyethyl)-thiazole monophosphate biosynthesis
MKILLLLLSGFEHMESAPFIDTAGWAKNVMKMDIDVVTCGLSEQVMSSFGVSVRVTIAVDRVDPGDYAALAIPGGFGTFGYYDQAYSEVVLDLIRAFDARNKPIASVCTAALPLGKSGVLKGRNATTYDLENGRKRAALASFGAEVIDKKIVTDGNIITSIGPATAIGVAFTLFERLTSLDETRKLMNLMGFDRKTI